MLGVAAILGVVVAYMRHDKVSDWLRSHCRYQIRTFWIGCLYALIAGISMTMLIVAFPISLLAGGLAGLFLLIWYVSRCVRGIGYLSRGEPHPDPTTWLVG